MTVSLTAGRGRRSPSRYHHVAAGDPLVTSTVQHTEGHAHAEVIDSRGWTVDDHVIHLQHTHRTTQTHVNSHVHSNDRFISTISA